VNNVESYVYGRIKAPQRRGASINYDDGNLSFAFWNDIFPDDREGAKPLKVDKSKAKLGDVIKLPTSSQPGVASYTVVAEPAPAPEPPRSEPPSAPTADRPGKKKGRAKSIPHALTAVGNIFRSERLKRAWSQKQMAAHLDRRAYLISDIELGDVTPDDDTLLLFSERFGISLDLLLSAREGKQEAAADPVFALSRIKELEQEVSASGTLVMEAQLAAEAANDARLETLAGLRAAEARIAELDDKLDKATMTWDAQALQAINEFIGRLTAVSPVPAEPEKRHAWYEAALKMFGASK
jgi:ribosome-binding protein aMBF1 (putative translation factor)